MKKDGEVLIVSNPHHSISHIGSWGQTVNFMFWSCKKLNILNKWDDITRWGIWFLAAVFISPVYYRHSTGKRISQCVVMFASAGRAVRVYTSRCVFANGRELFYTSMYVTWIWVFVTRVIMNHMRYLDWRAALESSFQFALMTLFKCKTDTQVGASNTVSCPRSALHMLWH